MSVAEIKETKSNLIAWIQGLSDTDMLAALDNLRGADTGKDWWDSLTNDQQNQINEGLLDAENGRVHSSDVFWKKLKK